MLVSQEVQGLPLVNRRDTALRPATNILGEDIWYIINSITNNVIVLRVLFKNGKQSKRFLENARHPVQCNTQLSATQIVSPAVETYHNLEPVISLCSTQATQLSSIQSDPSHKLNHLMM